MKILYVNKNINLSAPIIAQLEKMGFDVDVLIEKLPSRATKKNLRHRLMNIFYRVVKNDKTYFEKTDKRNFEKLVNRNLRRKEYDIAFFIRADMYPEDFIKKVRNRTKKMVNYQWDGLDVYPKIFEYFKYFDRLLVFNSYDIKKYPQYPLVPLPIFHYSKGKIFDKSKQERDLYYLGVGLEERIELARNIEKYALENHLKFKGILTIPDFKKEERSECVILQHKVVSLEENEKYAETSNAIVDFKLAEHNGVAFRYFECMNREQKLVTNNHHIEKYEFYHPDNIFICDFKDFTGLKEFLEKPYHKLDRVLVEKYGIENWVKYALDLPPYEKIDLPAL